jgi:uncharacterized protein
MSKNVFGEKLLTCSTQPMTGFYREGCCDTSSDDFGVHTVCAIMTTEFLEYSKEAGNDLTTPRPEYQFPGLQPGDHWCLCAPRWVEAWREGKAPLVYLEATHEKTLEYIDLHELVKFAWKKEKV